MVVKADGLECAPAASGSGLRAIVADCGGELLDRLQLCQVVCTNRARAPGLRAQMVGTGLGDAMHWARHDKCSEQQSANVTADRVSAHTCQHLT